MSYVCCLCFCGSKTGNTYSDSSSSSFHVSQSKYSFLVPWFPIGNVSGGTEWYRSSQGSESDVEPLLPFDILSNIRLGSKPNLKPLGGSHCPYFRDVFLGPVDGMVFIRAYECLVPATDGDTPVFGP